MTFSVLLYAGCSGLSAFSENAWQLAGLRFAGALGMGGEWALGVSLVMELWPNTSRGWLAGWIGAFGNLGYFIVGVIALALNRIGGELPNYLASVGFGPETVSSLTSFGNWRLLMLFGAIPAVLTLFIRFFVPESERWLKTQESGKPSSWSTADLRAVLIGAMTAAGIIAIWALDVPKIWQTLATALGLVIVTAAYLYPVRQFLRRSGASDSERSFLTRRMLLGAGLSGVPLLATWGGFMWIYPWLGKLIEGKIPDAVPLTQATSALGAAIGCLLGAVLGERFGRRIIYAILCGLSIVALTAMFQLNTEYGAVFVISAGVTGMITASFYGWLPLYLPELFPTKMRATGQGFSFNFGRILAAIGALQTANLLEFFGNDASAYAKACSIAAGIYILGLILIYFAPETKGQDLPE